MNENQKKEGSRDSLALIVGGLFILALVFATYNYFNKSSKTSETKKIESETVFQKEGDVNGSAATTSNKSETDKASGIETATGTGGPITVAQAATVWAANDYVKGDIQSGQYTVKYGDTLWEIAEAVYGNGAEWGKILEANKSSVGFLPNGSQALIYAGQTLTLP